jgi:predicted GNAT family acetyltransferase
VKSLERCHAKTVFDHWEYNYTTSLEEVADEIDELPSAGLFLKGSNQLVSWVMSHQPNGMSRLHTLTEHRKQGYASLVILYMAKRLAQAGYVPFANVEKTNTNSRQLFEKIGFRFIHFTNQLFLLSSTKNP